MHIAASVIVGGLASVAIGAAAAPETAAHVDLPSVGVAFDAPAGWTRRPEGTASQLARFVHVEGNRVVGSVVVEMAAMKDKSIADLAARIAAGAHAQVIDASPPLPGDAVELRMPKQPEYAAGLAAIRAAGDRALIVSSGGPDEAGAAAVLRAVLASISVTAPKPASENLAAPGVPRTLFDSQVTLTLPEPFRPGEKAKAGTQLSYVAHDWTTGKDDCTLTVQQMPNPKGLPVPEIARASTAALTEKFKLATPMTATHANDVPAAMVSSPFDAGDAKPSTQRIVWARLDGQHYVMLIFNVIAADAAAHDRYVALAESVAKGMKIGKPFASTRPAAPAKP